MNNQFWKNKKVLITGHTGFKGSWLTLWMSKLGADTIGYALAPSTNPSLFELANVADHCRSTVGDVRDKDTLYKVVQNIKPDIIFHLAAQPLVRDSYNDPLTTFETNVMGTANLLNAATSCDSVKAILVVTSDKCYRNNEWQWGYRENEPLGGHDPYSASKACTELVAQSWQQSFFSTNSNGCSIATARAGNVIGGGDWSKDRLIPDVLQSINSSKPIVLRNPQAIRPWQHVLEPLAGYLMLGEKLYSEGLSWAEAWNFGPSDADNQSVQWIVERLLKYSDQQTQWVCDSEQQPHEASLLKLDSTKARQILGWKNAWSLAECIKEIAHWNDHWCNGSDMNKVSYETIGRYLKSISI